MEIIIAVFIVIATAAFFGWCVGLSFGFSWGLFTFFVTLVLLIVIVWWFGYLRLQRRDERRNQSGEELKVESARASKPYLTLGERWRNLFGASNQPQSYMQRTFHHHWSDQPPDY